MVKNVTTYLIEDRYEVYLSLFITLDPIFNDNLKKTRSCPFENKWPREVISPNILVYFLKE